MRVAFCGGGTGGHVYPALTVAAALLSSPGSPPETCDSKRERADPKPGLEQSSSQSEGWSPFPGAPMAPELLYIGVRGRIDAELVAREDIPFRAVTAGPLRVGSPLGTAKGFLKLVAGVAQSYRILGDFRPDAVFATGGYGSAGVGIAAKLRRLPLIVFLPDVAAGFAVKTLVRIADHVAVSVQPALDVMPAAKTVLTGYPVRPGFFAAQRDAARAALGLDPALPTLLVTGGSTGATAINRNVASWLRDFLPNAQLLHISGTNDHAWLQEERGRLPLFMQQRYHLHDYLHHEMPLALAAADLGVMRAGASTLGELPATGLPAILIPGPFSDQTLNARYLESANAAVHLPQSRLEDLQTTVTTLLTDPDRLATMRQALAPLSRPDAAQRLANLVLETASRSAKVAV